MTLERFQTLAEAYGGSIARWPVDEQDAAWAVLAATPDEATRVLAEARTLDGYLDAVGLPSPSANLRRAILAAAPRARSPRPPVLRWLAGASVGIGLAAATAAGLVVGVSLSGAAEGEDMALLATVYDAGLFDDAGGES